MKILLYNFVQPDEPGRPGGGVSVYLDSLARMMMSTGDDVVLLSSGDRYGLVRRRPFLKVVGHRPTRALVFNSPQIAPARSSFHHPEIYCDDKGLDAIPAALKASLGHFDVFHFHNIEGLTAGFFRSLRNTYPDSKFIFSAHNYNLVCPQVNLWRSESAHCDDYDDGKACIDCVPVGDIRNSAIRIKRVQTPLKGIVHLKGGAGLSKVYSLARRLFALGGEPGLKKLHAPAPFTAESAERFTRFRTTNVELCRSVFDTVIAVSRQTAKVLDQHGIPSSKTQVSYIGSSHHALIDPRNRVLGFKEGLHIAYLGYMRKDKGFDFLIECLEALDAESARSLTVTIAARYRDEATVARLRALGPRFCGFRLFDGYTRESMGDVLEGVHLGIVPPMWEDNLPQVAIELVCRGIPILTSNRGGASELANQPQFVFRAGDRQDFVERIKSITSRRILLSEFWTGSLNVRSMEQHILELREIYGAPTLRIPDVADMLPHASLAAQ